METKKAAEESPAALLGNEIGLDHLDKGWDASFR
jgi:hypothetical protein